MLSPMSLLISGGLLRDMQPHIRVWVVGGLVSVSRYMTDQYPGQLTMVTKKLIVTKMNGAKI